MNNDGTQPAFATPAGVEALKWMQDTVNAMGGNGPYLEYQKKFKNVGEAMGKDVMGVSLFGVWVLGQQIFPVDATTPIAQWPMPGGPSAKGKQFGFFNATSCVVPAAARVPTRAGGSPSTRPRWRGSGSSRRRRRVGPGVPARGGERPRQPATAPVAQARERADGAGEALRLLPRPRHRRHPGGAQHGDQQLAR